MGDTRSTDPCPSKSNTHFILDIPISEFNSTAPSGRSLASSRQHQGPEQSWKVCRARDWRSRASWARAPLLPGQCIHTRAPKQKRQHPQLDFNEKNPTAEALSSFKFCLDSNASVFSCLNFIWSLLVPIFTAIWKPSEKVFGGTEQWGDDGAHGRGCAEDVGSGNSRGPPSFPPRVEKFSLTENEFVFIFFLKVFGIIIPSLVLPGSRLTVWKSWICGRGMTQAPKQQNGTWIPGGQKNFQVHIEAI